MRFSSIFYILNSPIKMFKKKILNSNMQVVASKELRLTFILI